MAFRVSVVLSVLLISAFGSAGYALPPVYSQDSAQSVLRAATALKKTQPDRRVAVILDVDETLVLAKTKKSRESRSFEWKPIFDPQTFRADYSAAVGSGVDVFFCSCGGGTQKKLLEAYGLVVYARRIFDDHPNDLSKWDFDNELWVSYQIGLTSDPVSIFFVDNTLNKVLSFGNRAHENSIAEHAQLVLVWFDVGNFLDPQMNKKRFEQYQRRNFDQVLPKFIRGGIPDPEDLKHSWRLFFCTGAYQGTLVRRFHSFVAAVRSASAEPLTREVLGMLPKPPVRLMTWAQIHQARVDLFLDKKPDYPIAEWWPEQELAPQLGAAGIPMDLVPLR